MRANIMQSPKLHLSKYDKSRSNVVFTSYLPRFCYGGNSVFSSSESILPFLDRYFSTYVLILEVNIVMSLPNSSSIVKFSSLTAFATAQNNFTAVEVHAYDLRDSNRSSPITDPRLGN